MPSSSRTAPASARRSTPSRGSPPASHASVASTPSRSAATGSGAARRTADRAVGAAAARNWLTLRRWTRDARSLFRGVRPWPDSWPPRKVAERVIFMDGGRIVEDAPTDAFFESARSERAQLFLSKILRH